MSKLKIYHVLPYVNGGWQMKEECTGLTCGIHNTKGEIIARAKELAHAQKPCLIFIHKEDGTIQAGYTYGNYSFPPKSGLINNVPVSGVGTSVP